MEKSLIFRSNTPYSTDIVSDPGGQDPLFCVQLDDCKQSFFSHVLPLLRGYFFELHVLIVANYFDYSYSFRETIVNQGLDRQRQRSLHYY